MLWNWLTSIPTTVWGSLIAGLMTLVGVIVGQYAIQRREEQKKAEETEALRNALAVELRTYDEWLEWLMYTAHDLEKLQENAYALTEEQYEKAFENDLNARISLFRYAADDCSFSRTVFESNAEKLGELDSRTAEAVVRTHGIIDSLEQRLEQLKDSISHEELMFPGDIDWSTGAGLPSTVWFQKIQIQETVVRAVIYQKITLSHLGDSGSKSDRANFAFAYANLNPKSEEDLKVQEYLKQSLEKHDVSSFEELVNMEAQRES